MPSIAFIGGGNMARGLIAGLCRQPGTDRVIHVADPDAGKRNALAAQYGVRTHADNAAAAEQAEVVVIAVEPRHVEAVCRRIGPLLTPAKLLISIAAGVRTDQVEAWCGHAVPLVRVMPNMPAQIGAGACALYATPQVDATQRAAAEALLAASGICAWIDDEGQMNTVTAVSGSGPAYFFLLAEALENAAAEFGLPRDTARRLIAQTCLGAGRLLAEGGESARRLRERVTSPNGTTAAALESFAGNHFADLVRQAVAAARRRGEELAG